MIDKEDDEGDVHATAPHSTAAGNAYVAVAVRVGGVASGGAALRYLSLGAGEAQGPDDDSDGTDNYDDGVAMAKAMATTDRATDRLPNH